MDFEDTDIEDAGIEDMGIEDMGIEDMGKKFRRVSKGAIKSHYSRNSVTRANCPAAITGTLGRGPLS
jgi:hypothetical protein